MARKSRWHHPPVWNSLWLPVHRCAFVRLEDAHTGIHHAVDEADGLQVLRTHHILVVDFKLVASFVYYYNISIILYNEGQVTLYVEFYY